jgi:hypothetical protein
VSAGTKDVVVRIDAESERLLRRYLRLRRLVGGNRVDTLLERIVDAEDGGVVEVPTLKEWSL